MIGNRVKREEELLGHSAANLVYKTNCHLGRICHTVIKILLDERFVSFYHLATVCERLANVLFTENYTADSVVIVTENDILYIHRSELIKRVKILGERLIESNALGGSTVALKRVTGNDGFGGDIIPAYTVVIVTGSMDNLKTSLKNLAVSEKLVRIYATKPTLRRGCTH